MATQTNKTVLGIPNLPSIDELTNRAEQLRDGVEETARSLGRQAREFLPEPGKRGVDAVLETVNDVTDEVTVRVDDLRKVVDTRVNTLRKETTKLRKETDKRRKKAVKTVETTGRKQVERLYKRFSLPVSSDLTALKRRMTQIERKLDQLLEEKKAAA